VPSQAALLPIPKPKRGLPAFLPRRFRERLDSRKKQQVRFALMAAARERIDDALAQ
jgi:hypothetical protein